MQAAEDGSAQHTSAPKPRRAQPIPLHAMPKHLAVNQLPNWDHHRSLGCLAGFMSGRISLPSSFQQISDAGGREGFLCLLLEIKLQYCNSISFNLSDQFGVSAKMFWSYVEFVWSYIWKKHLPNVLSFKTVWI